MSEHSERPKATAVPIAKLHPAAWSPRSISEERLDNLCRSIEADPEFLWDRPVLAQSDGTVYAGVMRLRAAHVLGLSTIPVIIEEVSDQVARERALRDNQQWGRWDDDGLAEILARLAADGADLEVLGLEDRDIQRLLDGISSPVRALTDPEEVPPLRDDPESRPGDIWYLGADHRVLCGDSRNVDDVARLMAGETAACLWTDPPYGVGYIGGTSEHLTLLNDTAEGLDELLRRAFVAIDPVLQPGAPLYVCQPSGAGSLVFGERFVGQGWQLRQTLCWVKDRLVLGHGDYHYQHELILYGYKGGYRGRRGRGARGWYGDNAATTVFEVPTPTRNAEHPTSKPLALVEPMIRNSTRRGEIVLDPFLGSGTALIVAERLGRRCFGIDLDPRYVDVAVARWEAVTGGKAVREPR